MKANRSLTRLSLIVILCLSSVTMVLGDETKWLAVGMLHEWYSSMGCEIEVGRRHLVSDQQDGLRWPAQFNWQDCKAAKALWIGAKNYNDPLAGKTFDYKVVHIGPRVWDEKNEFMPQQFKLIGRFERPRVYVDDTPAGFLDYMDAVDEVDPNAVTDRILYNVVNTGIGITEYRTIYAFSQQFHNNYFIYDYVFKNTGIIDNKGTVNVQTLQDVVFFFQYRYTAARETGPYGYYYLPQSAAWGHCTMNDTMLVYDQQTGQPYLSEFSWTGKHSKATFDCTGGPNGSAGGDGHLGGAQFTGNLVLHADKSAQDKSNDPNQPTTTQFLGSDVPITSSNDQFNAAKMAEEYAAMTAGHPPVMHADAVGDGFADVWGGTPGGFSHCLGFGPYTLAPGDSIHIVIAEGIDGLCRDSCYTIGARWLKGQPPFRLPNGSTTNNKDEYKNAWVLTGRDSLKKMFQRTIENYKLKYNIPLPPPPPDEFRVNSGGDRIVLTWSNSAESWPGFAGYRLFRAIHKPDTTYDEIFACGAGTAHPQVVNRFEDKTAVRGFDYYYYVVTFDDGLHNNSPANPGGSLQSSMFYTRTSNPAKLKRQSGQSLEAIRVVPNPYNIKARDLQYGISGQDRIMFLDIPPYCTIKIFTERGDLIYTIEHTDGSGDAEWNSITSSRQVVVSGVYIAYFEVTQDYYDANTGELLFKKGDNAIRKFIIIR
ncbi:MAG: fibronectin [candidate division KSB1 bacterium]|nr:fibronectin [candidate division KSB1 bacterium]MDZ7318685.1 fibronectin [candidate division KSB1 bacterium]MDZ7339952.1 fibronectin [candidate division KSB1 bacterium]